MTTWLVCINPNLYDYISASNDLGIIEYYHIGNYEIGEIAYLYIPYTEKRIRYKAVVIANYLKYEETAKYLHKSSFASKEKYCRFKVIEEINDTMLSIKAFHKFDIYYMSGAKKISGEFLTYIESVFARKTERWERFSRSVEILSEPLQEVCALPDDEKKKIEIKLYDKKIAEIDMKEGKYYIETNSVLSNDGNKYPIEDISAIEQLIQHINDNRGSILEDIISEEFDAISDDLSESRLTGKDKEVIAKARINQSVFRKGLIKKYKSCCLCGVSDKELLMASHIKPWADSSGEERTDFDNGLLLCPNHDRLFDRRLITFDEEGKIIISRKIDNHDRKLLRIDNCSIKMSAGTKKYMKYHREKFLKDNEDAFDDTTY